MRAPVLALAGLGTSVANLSTARYELGRLLSGARACSLSVTSRAGLARRSWNESWTGLAVQCVHSVLSERSAGRSVQAVRCGRVSVAMVRRRSTVRFRKGAPGHRPYFEFNRDPECCFVDRVMETLSCSECTGCAIDPVAPITWRNHCAGQRLWIRRRDGARMGAYICMTPNIFGRDDRRPVRAVSADHSVR